MSVDSSHTIELTPSNTYNSKSPIQFDVPPSPTEFTRGDLYLLISVKIKNADNSSLLNNADVAPTANFAHSMFRDV